MQTCPMSRYESISNWIKIDLNFMPGWWGMVHKVQTASRYVSDFVTMRTEMRVWLSVSNVDM